jgi:hypothetical protein
MQKTTIFDKCRGYEPVSNLGTFTDATVTKRDNRWWMFGSGFDKDLEDLNIFSASLPPDAPLSVSGWTITIDPANSARAVPVCGKTLSLGWDGKGGRHCPSHVCGYDPKTGKSIERLYYAGASGDFFGPYAIGFLEWDGRNCVDQACPAFVANEDWEHGSVCEPNVVYHDGKWKMWYAAGNNLEDYIVQGYSESEDGITGWTQHQIVFPWEERVFDFNVRPTIEGAFEAMIARINTKGRKDLPKTGLWWIKTKTPSERIEDWSEPIRIAEPVAGKPSLQYGEADHSQMFVFNDGISVNTSGRGMPYCYTIECLKIEKTDLT